MCCPGVDRRASPAIVYVAHLGQARADAGTGYELDAIAAVVLGGTSVFGGRGTHLGHAVGLFAIAVLQNGLHLAALPSELTGVLVGALLVATIAHRSRCVGVRAQRPAHRWRRKIRREECSGRRLCAPPSSPAR